MQQQHQAAGEALSQIKDIASRIATDRSFHGSKRILPHSVQFLIKLGLCLEMLARIMS